MLSLKHLSGRIIWSLIILLAGVLLAGSFGFLDASGSRGESTRNWPLPTLKLSISQIDLRVEASASGAQEVAWKYRLLTSGEPCNRSTFALSPNHPALHTSNVLTIPETDDLQDYYRNRFVCFQAIARDTSARQAYKVWGIDLGKPRVTVVRHYGAKSGQRSYLQASASEPVTYRVAEVAVASEALDGPTAGNHCSTFFAGFQDADQLEGVTASTGRVYLEELIDGFCFEATDVAGNQTYVYADQWAGRIRAFQWRGGLRAFLRGTSADVEWSVFVSDSADCDDDAFSGAGVATVRSRQLPASQELVLLASSHGKHYCFRAVEALGHQGYRSLQVDLNPALPMLESKGGILSISATRPILEALTIGPLSAVGRRPHQPCRQLFENAIYLDTQKPVSGTKIKIDATNGGRYCVMIRDDRNQRAYGEIRIQ